MLHVVFCYVCDNNLLHDMRHDWDTPAIADTDHHLVRVYPIHQEA